MKHAAHITPATQGALRAMLPAPVRFPVVENAMRRLLTLLILLVLSFATPAPAGIRRVSDDS